MADTPETSDTDHASQALRETPGPRETKPAALSNSLERRITVTRLTLWWERAWPSLWPSVGILGTYGAIALTGVLSALPLLLQWLALLACITGASLFAWHRRETLKWPTRDNTLRRLEELNGVPHRPLSTYADQPAKGTGSPQLWAAHQTWLHTRLAGLRLKLPTPGLAARDPMALRAALVLCLVATFVSAGPNARPRLEQAFFPGLVGQGKPGRLDAWITPPGYTGRAPVFLANQPQGVIEVPQTSTLNIQVFGGSSPNITLGAEELAPQIRHEGENAAYEIATTLPSDANLSITQGTYALGSWQINVVADTSPEVTLLEQIEITRRNSLHFVYEVKDDYGVTDLNVEMVLDPVFVLQDKTIFWLGDERPARSGFSPLLDGFVAERINTDFDLPLPGVHPRQATRSAFRDLTAHPWAGLPVQMTLVATDHLGQEGRSRTVTFSLPARRFEKPLAAALIEQRQRLALSPLNRGSVAGFLNAFTLDADTFLEDKTVYLGLRAAYWRLLRARHPGALNGVSELLWDLALHIEDGGLSLAERDLRAAREALTQALGEETSPEELEQLMQELKEALARYLDELANRATAQADQDPSARNNDQLMDRSEMEEMLDAIADLARTGAREQAQDLLAQLDEILENLNTDTAQSGMTQGENTLSDAISEMGEMIDQQRSLMDETFQHGQGGQTGSQADEQGQSGTQPNASPLESLQEQQEALRQQLQDLMGKLDDKGQAVPGGLEQAAEAMGRAQDRLAQGRADTATKAQGQAVDQLQQGAQALADALFQSMAERGEQAGDQAGGDMMDPLGRPLRSGPDRSRSTALPDELDMQRARQILDELRKRAADLGRPQDELDYLERLLRRF